MTSREVARAARRWADQSTDRAAERPPEHFMAKVLAVSPLTVKWRGSVNPLPARRHASYTPAVNDWVTCKTIDGQIVVEDIIV